jgi:zinc transport system substrate-binding protein
LKTPYHGGLAILLFLLALSSGALRAEEARLQIVTTIKPLQLLVMAIAGDEQTVDVLLDPRMSPHDYQLRPSERKKLDRANVVFWIGPGMETFMVPVLSALDRRVTVVALGDGVAAGDPHLWMDPLLSVALGYKIADALEKLAPTNDQRWRNNAARLEGLLTAEDKQLRERFAGIERPRGYMVAHDAYGRFETRYGLRHSAALTDSSDLPPSAQHIAQIEAALRSGTISCVMREQTAPPKLLQTLLKGRDARVEVIDAMALEIPLRGDAIVDFYRQLGAAMSRCLMP